MDTLALLCNLHGDGPETLQRLRSAGWDTLREIEEVDLLALARALGEDNDADRAQRFQREAGFLRERLGEDIEPGTSKQGAEKSESRPASGGTGLLPEAQMPRSAEPKRRVLDTPLSNRILEKTVAASSSPAAKVGGANSDYRRPFAAARLRGQSSLNRDVVSSGELEAANDSSLPHEDAEVAKKNETKRGACELELPAREVFIPRPSAVNPQPPTPPISPAALNPKWEQAAENRVARIPTGAIDGLDEARCVQLADAGVRTLTELSQAETLELSEECGIDYTGLLRLQFLARRELVVNPEADPKQASHEDENPGFDGSTEDDGVAGPFA